MTSVRFGVCGRKFPEAAQLGPERVLDRVAELGFDGVFFRSILDLDPQLDADHLRDLRARADDHGLYLEVGLGKVNPFNTPETPLIRALGAGDYRLGMENMIRAARAIGCTELWADTANSQDPNWGLHAIDRFRTDVTWADQLQATERFLSMLAPVLREQGCRVDLETHEEITTPELLALIQAVGADVLGVTLDLANVVVRGEDPLAATRRVAPYVHLTHMRDVILYLVAEGLERQIRSCGEGIIDWHVVLTQLANHHADLHLTVENVAGRDRSCIRIYDPRWQASHPDLSDAEVQTLVRHAHETEARMQRGDIPDQDNYFPKAGLSVDEQVDFIRRCHAHLRQVLSNPAQGVADQDMPSPRTMRARRS